jgi:RHS repeat-associated protein
MTAAGELTTIIDGVSGHYFVTDGSSGTMLVRGGIIDGVETESGTFYLIVRLDQADPSSPVQRTGLYRVRPGSSTFESVAVDLEKPRELQVDRLSRIYVYDEATASIWRYGTDGERELMVPDIDDFRGMAYDNATNRLLFASRAGLRCLAGDDSVSNFITESGGLMPDDAGRPVVSPEGDVMVFGIGTDTDGNYEIGLFRFGADGVFKDFTESDLDGFYQRWEQTVLGKVWSLTGDIRDGSASFDRFILGLTREEDGLYRNTTHHTKRLSKHDDEWTFDDGRGDIRHYGLDGLLRSATDRNGNTTTYAYDGQGRLTAMVDPVGATTLFGYGDNGRLARIQDPIGRSTLFETDGRGDLVAVTFPDGSRRRYDYDAHHCIVKKSDGLGQTMAFSVNDQGVYSQITYADGTTTQFEAQRPQALAHSDPVPGVNRGYDADLPAGVSAEEPDGLVDANGNRSHYLLDERGYPLTEIDALGNTSSTVRDADDRIIVTRDGRGNEVNLSYDLAGNLKKTTRADGTTISTEYDPVLNLPITVTDPRGHSSFFAYDADGNLIASTDALGNVTTYTYNSRGLALSRTNALGETTRWTYDAQGNPQTITDPLGAITTLTNDAAGRVIAATDPLGHTTTFAYDGFDRLLARTTADGATIHFTYDANGNRTSMTDALGQVTRYAYDATDQLVKITAPDDSETRFVYDANGNRTQIIDPLGHSLTYRYDAANRLTDVTDALGRTTHFLLDENGNRILTADPLGRTTAILYDALDRPVRTTAPDEGITTFAYDPAGNLVELTDPLRHQTTWEYDALNRVLETTDPLNRTRLASYDAAGRIATQTNGRGQVLSYAYDAAGRPRSLDLAGTESITWSYDAAGNPLRVADGDSVVDTTYDAMNRPTSVQQAYGVLGYSYDLSGRRTQLTGAAGAIDYAYDALNRLTGLTDPSARHYGLAYDLAGRLTKQTNPNATYSLLGYDAANQLSDKAHYAGSGMALGDNTYLYDAAGNVMGWGTSDGNIRAFAYDANNRLTAVQSTLPAVENESFAYDKAGNWAPFDARVHNEANEISEDSGYRYTYDLDGNLMRKESKLDPTDVTTYAWDPLNRLIQVNGGEHVVSYRYDGLGRRIAKTVDGVETRYVLDGANVVEERDASGTLTAFNLYAGLDRLLMRRDYGTGATYWTQTDHLGSVESLTDAAGTVVERYRYGSFGRLSVLAPDFSPRASAPLIPFTYTGREWEPEVGMYFFRARFMDPRLGRFISQDPIGLDGGINGYAYCGNNPVMMIDPNGMQDGMAGLAGMTGFNSAQDAYNYAQLQQINQSPTVQAAQAHAQLESLPSVTIVVGISGQGGAALPVGPAAQVTPFSIGVSLSPARGIQAGVLAGGGFGGQILASYSSTVFFQVTNASSLDALKGQGYVLGASGGEGVVIGGDVVTGWANGRPSPSSLFGGQLSIGLGGGFPVEAHAMPTYTIGLTTKQSNLLPPAHEPNGRGRK